MLITGLRMLVTVLNWGGGLAYGGGSLSEPATLVDLGAAVRCIYVRSGQREPSGWAVPGAQMCEVVQGAQHVDDALVFSTVWCEQCLYDGVRKTWPADCGTSLEEGGDFVRFLSATIRVVNGTQLEIRPHFH